MKSRPPTSHDVAKLAGVSRSAVSRAFTPGASVSSAMRERIGEAASRLGYRPSLLPKMMLRGETGIVAVVAGGFYNPFYSMTLEAFARALRAAGKQVMLVQAESDRALDGLVGELTGYRVDGVVTALSILSQSVADELAHHRLPIVTLNSAITNEWVRTVVSDNRSAGREAAVTLNETGGGNFAYIAGPADSLAQTERQAGFLGEIARLGASCDIQPGDYTYAGGYRAGQALLAGARRIDSLFCVNDLTAMGAMDALRIEAGLLPRRDYRIIGYDNIGSADWAAYRLASFDQQADVMAAHAVEMLGQDRQTAPVRLVAPLFVARESCLPC